MSKIVSHVGNLGDMIVRADIESKINCSEEFD
jgi:hypothetical protein